MEPILVCVFCDPPSDRVFFETDFYICMWDGFPVSPDHALVIPKRHFSSWFEATNAELQKLLEGIEKAREEILAKSLPDGFNIGVNVGEAAGQTVHHLHVHVIPRYRGDVQDPRGGVRHVIASKANYLAEQGSISEPAAGYAANWQKVDKAYGLESRPLKPAIVADLYEAKEVSIAVAFITESGLREVKSVLIEVLQRGGKLNLLTGDYLDVTEPNALLGLLDLAEGYEQTCDIRFFKVTGNLGFHPKIYFFRQHDESLVTYVGSSNLTRHAMLQGIEWNQRIVGDSESLGTIAGEFYKLFNHEKSIPLTQSLIDEYLARRVLPESRTVIPGVDLEEEVPESPPFPNGIQEQALSALKCTREEGFTSGLVVLATGVGKTWLAAFDSADSQSVLFVAHREEILDQARETFRRIRPSAKFGRYGGGEYDRNVDVLFASIQTLGKQAHLDRFGRGQFDYIVVDEFHHASASTYRRLIDYFDPRFLLGLTATPDRSDGADLLALCGNNLVFRCDVGEAITQELLSPFSYFGVPDVVDFKNIPWRNGKFDITELENAVVTEARARNSFEQWQKRAQNKTLAFCVSQKHADYIATYFNNHGANAVAVHSGANSAPRRPSLEALSDGELDVVFAVDMFNEGVDVPAIDTVLMLRPTESKILWLQQFGRGLRKAADKSKLVVIDYVGNHRSFLQPLNLLLGYEDAPMTVAALVQALESGSYELPPGCNVEYELEAIALLKSLVRPSGQQIQVEEWYQYFKEINEIRPTANEAYLAGFDPKSLRKAYNSWFEFVNAQNDLSEREMETVSVYGKFLSDLEKTPMAKSYKMAVLSAMIACGSFPGEISLDQLVKEVLKLINRGVLDRADFGSHLKSESSLQSMLVSNPISAWVGGKGMSDKSYFAFDGAALRTVGLDGDNGALKELVQEVADYRLSQYFDRSGEAAEEDVELQLWHPYMREKIPALWGFEFNTGSWNVGYVQKEKHIFLLVTLTKANMNAAAQFDDKFLSASDFQWMSQNKTTQNSKAGMAIFNHVKDGTEIHLFVRKDKKTTGGKAAPFVYCGDVEFRSWEDERPIRVMWELKNELPEALQQAFIE
jgi:superfamily II DNA or RNA helicase/diadenosine tetraphosphate (Ap4A) HIT family hydrolase/HKD family nuclease